MGHAMGTEKGRILARFATSTNHGKEQLEKRFKVQVIILYGNYSIVSPASSPECLSSLV